MTDVSGIPNMGFGGGGYFGGNAATGQPAMSSAQIMASLYGNYSPGQAQSTLNNIYGPQGFGGQTAQYAAQGAAYGRAGGGGPNYQRRMGIQPLSQPPPMGSTFNQSTYGANSGSLGVMSPFGGYHPSGGSGAQNFNDLFRDRGRVYQPPVIESPYGPGGYPPMEPRTPQQQSNLNWYGGPSASS